MGNASSDSFAECVLSEILDELALMSNFRYKRILFLCDSTNFTFIRIMFISVFLNLIFTSRINRVKKSNSVSYQDIDFDSRSTPLVKAVLLTNKKVLVAGPFIKMV